MPCQSATGLLLLLVTAYMQNANAKGNVVSLELPWPPTCFRHALGETMGLFATHLQFIGV